ncbi:MAG: class I SAM-dependent methyltransferase [Chitinophagaceae bacterium]
MITLNFTTERTGNQFLPDNYVFQRHLYAYKWAALHVSGNLLEVGCGNGYGLSELKPVVRNYVGIDKSKAAQSFFKTNGADFFAIKAPSLKNIPSNIFDSVVSFQVIEHIKNDSLFLQEICRVLKPGGKLYLTTPNRLTSLTRNPWHVREYSSDELTALVKKYFEEVKLQGLFGNEVIDAHLRENKIAVSKLVRFDIFNLQKNAPRFMLKLPYQLLNFYTKKKLAAAHHSLVSGISYTDFFLNTHRDSCLDLYITAVKQPGAGN